MTQPIRALSVRQPWATAIVHLRKDIENRTRCFGHRGLTLIHASAGMTDAEHDEAVIFMRDRGLLGRDQRWNLHRGGIIGAVDVLDCVRDHSSPWFMGPLGYVVANPRPIPFIPCKGTVTPLFWVPDPAVQARARHSLGLPA